MPKPSAGSPSLSFPSVLAITQMLNNLKKYRIILASKSPRRRQLLSQIRVPYEIMLLSGIKEQYPATLSALEVAPYLSKLKAEAYKSIIKSNELVITADTVVVADNKVLGKPATLDEARHMLTLLSGRTHVVVTGVTITTLERTVTFDVKTEVKFGPLTPEEIDFYVDGYTPLDKAGAYGIQEWIGGVAVESINGSFYNVMGLPLQRLYQELKNF